MTFKFLFLGLLLGLLGHPTFAGISVTATYSETANILQLFDCVSERNTPDTEGDCQDDGGYLKDWIKRFGPLSSKDRELLHRYSVLRAKYFQDPDGMEDDSLKNRNGFFARIGSETSDKLGDIFRSGTDLENVSEKLNHFLAKDEARFLQKFFSHFETRYHAYIKENAAYITAAKRLNTAIQRKDFQDFFSRIERFYVVEGDLNFQVVFVWWPLLNRTRTPHYGRFFVMERHPTSIDLSKAEEDIITHEIVHSISARQSLGQKQKLTKEFLSGCDPHSKVKALRILEEPLAVAIGQMIFLKKFKIDEFEKTKRWYRNSWVNEFALLIFSQINEAFQSGKNITDGIVPKLTPLCKNLYGSRSEFP